MTREIKESPLAIAQQSEAREKWAQYDTPTKAKAQLRVELLALLQEFELGCPQLMVSDIRMDRYTGWDNRLGGVDVTVEVR